MDTQQNSVHFSFEARYFTLGELNQQTKQIWLVCHGYGQLASYFIRHFQPLADADHYIVAPEGLSRFYLEGFSGRVGASWMTKESRLTDITNYENYISAVYEKAIGHYTASDIPLNILGFSQGVATAARWAIHSKVTINKLVLWAGVFPPDLPFQGTKEALKGKEVYLVFGSKDRFVNEKTKNEQKEALMKLEVEPKVLEFEGEHTIHSPLLQKFI